MHNYKKLVKKVREKSFPEIKGKIWIIKIPFPIPGASILWLLPKLNLLAFSTACKKLKENIIIEIIAHELSHFSMFQKGTWREFWKFVFTATKEEGIINERETDKLAIRKGYGKELIATKKKAVELLKGTRWENKLDNYLTTSEVKKYVRKIENNN